MKDKRQVEIYDREASGERILWASVLHQAIDDATSRHPSVRADMDRKVARAWLTQPSGDFDIVCNLAGLDPDFVREGVSRLIQQSDLLPLKAHAKRRSQSTAGVVPDFQESEGTGVGSNAQDRTELEFS